jgi:hypothetical protein
VEIVCASGGEGDRGVCPQEGLVEAFENWAGPALLRPASTFTVWAPGAHPGAHARLFVTCVPPAWGTNPQRAKARFVVRTREALTAGMPRTADGTIHGCSSPTGSRTAGTRQLVVLGASLRITANYWQAVANAGVQRAPLRMLIVCDRSNSTAGQACERPALRDAFDLWLADSGATPGSTIIGYRVGHSRDTAARAYAFTLEGGTPGERVASALSARGEIGRLADGDPERNASAIVEALHVGATELRERQARYRMVILSDLRQVTPSVWNFEEFVPDASRFIVALHDQRLMADLHEVPVIVCGVHHERGARAGAVGASSALRVREVWSDALREMGASDVQMFSTCSAAFRMP